MPQPPPPPPQQQHATTNNNLVTPGKKSNKSQSQSQPPPAPEKPPKPHESLSDKGDIYIVGLIGKGSSNGFITELLSQEDFNLISENAKATNNYILKSARSEKHTNQQKIDSLMYEFEVGLYINTLLPYFPCFLRTHDLYYYKESKTPILKYLENKKFYNEDVQQTKETNVSKNIEIVPVDNQTDYNPESCLRKNDFAVLIDNFEGVTLQTLIDENKIYSSDKAKILFQIYAPLYAVGQENFRHKDLHANNVMVKTLDNPIRFQYEFGDELGNKLEKTTFKTKYLAKMIDYGRCHIPSTEEYVDRYHEIRADDVQKHKYEYTLNECGLIHVLYDYSDLELYKKMFADTNSQSIENVLTNLYEKIDSNPQSQPLLPLPPHLPLPLPPHLPLPPPSSRGGKKKTKSKTKSKNKPRKSNKKPRKSNKRSKKMKGGNNTIDGTLTIFCTQGEERKPMEYTGTNVYISDMVHVNVHEPKQLF